jgi:uncharacterized repeat protein (TIGR01451 family)
VKSTTLQVASSESYSYQGSFSTVPDHYTVEVDGPEGKAIQPVQSYQINESSRSFSGTGSVEISAEAPTGNYTVSVYYYAKGSTEWESNAMKVFRVIPAPTTTTPPPITESIPTVVKAPLAPQSVSLPAKLALVKTAARKIVKDGQTVKFTLKVTDIGKGAATNVQVCDQVPAHTTVASAPTGSFVGGKVCYHIGTLQAGASATRFITLRVDSDAPQGMIVNHAVASAANTSSVKAQAAIKVPAHATPTHKAAVTG